MPVQGPGYMLNLTVSDIHTYYVLSGKTPVLVHNDDGFSPQEQGILSESQGIYSSPEFDQIRAAYEEGKSTSVTIRGVSIDYIPSLPSSGFSNRPYGFVMGPEAFTSEAETKKTILHEMYRVRVDLIGQHGYSADIGKQETGEAFDFAERAYGSLC